MVIVHLCSLLLPSGAGRGLMLTTWTWWLLVLVAMILPALPSASTLITIVSCISQNPTVFTMGYLMHEFECIFIYGCVYVLQLIRLFPLFSIDSAVSSIYPSFLPFQAANAVSPKQLFFSPNYSCESLTPRY